MSAGTGAAGSLSCGCDTLGSTKVQAGLGRVCGAGCEGGEGALGQCQEGGGSRTPCHPPWREMGACAGAGLCSPALQGHLGHQECPQASAPHLSHGHQPGCGTALCRAGSCPSAPAWRRGCRSWDRLGDGGFVLSREQPCPKAGTSLRAVLAQQEQGLLCVPG